VDRMRRTTRRIGSCAVLLAAALAAGPAPAQPDVRLPGVGGGQLTGADLAHGATVIVIWASWSPRCRDIVERVNAVASRWGGKARVVTVDFQEDPAAVQEFLRGKNLAVPVYLDRDGEFSKSHAVTTLPGLVVFRDGAARYEGKLPADVDATLSPILG
jgi:thiol-disulfide isomerase/thioredoxin